MDKRLLAILRCPVTHKELSLASGPTLKEVNAAIDAGKLSNRDGRVLDQSLDEALVTEVCREHDVTAVVHFAAHKSVGDSMVDPGPYWTNNVQGTVHLIEGMLAAGVRNIVFSSSAAVDFKPKNPVTAEVVSDNPLPMASPVSVNPFATAPPVSERPLPIVSAPEAMPPASATSSVVRTLKPSIASGWPCSASGATIRERRVPARSAEQAQRATAARCRRCARRSRT